MARFGQLFGSSTHDQNHDGADDQNVVEQRNVDGTMPRESATERVAVLDRDDDRAGITTTRRDALSRDADTNRDVTKRDVTDRDDTDRDDTDRDVRSTAVMAPVVDAPMVDRDRDGVDDRVEAKPVEEVAPVRPARASMFATLGVVFGVVGVAAALTGLLAPFAIPIGAVGLLLSFGGVIAGAKPHVAGRGLGTLGALLCITAIVFGILAMNDATSWLDSGVDQVAKLRTWADTQMTWMKGW